MEGLEQIRGALRLGMDDIAKETVEFLFEDFGGLPTNIKFPTQADVNQLRKKSSVNNLDVGKMVRIVKINNEIPSDLYKKTLQGVGVVIGLKYEKICKVETYLESEGVTVKFWYA